MKPYSQFEFHQVSDKASVVIPFYTDRQDIEFTYTFENFFHPFVGELIQKLNKDSLPGLLDPKYHQSLKTDFFNTFYTLLTSELVKIESFPKEIDLRYGGPYANYNWELLFHVPLTIAVHLSKNQRFAEAQRWFHYIFDPTCTDTSVPTPQRFWKFLAFRQAGDVMQIDELLRLLSKKDPTPEEEKLRESILAGYEASKNKPFQPHAVARTRQIAYQYNVVMKYLDNLIAWGDSLFRQDTIESINEATQIYVLASNLLGPRPQRIPSSGTTRPKTFAQLKARGLDATGNALVELEGKFPLNLGLPQIQGKDPDAAAPLFGIGRTLYFCIPHNDKLLGYWDTVADRLFKIRHCMNIEGIVRQLALFDPPIDPGMLVKAAAAGIDIGSIVNGLNQPASPVRAILFIQKALELCSEVRSLGGALLAAIEKGEGERLALLRQSHEIKIQQMQQDVRFLQWKQAQEATKSLLTSRATALERLHYYQRLLGLPADPNAPDTLGLDPRELDEENFDETYAALVGQYEKTLTLQKLPDLKLAEESGNITGYSGSGKVYLSENEDIELNVHLPKAREETLWSTVFHATAATLAPIPDGTADAHFWGLGGTIDLKVGTMLSTVARLTGDAAGATASWERDQASMASRYASYERRADDWLLQHNMAAHELMQIGRQILTSLITEQVAHHEYENTKKLIENAQEVDRFLQEKFTNEELYAWMQGEISRLYYEYYRFAFDTARKAEQTMKRELMRPEVDATTYIKFNYWDGGRKGLLSGEALYLDLKRMEMAYHENNKREYELTKHVSLLQLSPLALMQLRTTGRCTVSLPEELFDMDGPGHYFRRIKTVAVSIPCVTGPYTSINCTLTMLKSSIRTKPVLTDGSYERSSTEDARFNDSFGSLQTIVTSTGQNDSGLFETNLRDERYLPFEGAGVISEWQLALPANPSKKEPCQFDYNTISDVILHIRYTARESGGSLKIGAITNLTNQINAAQTVGSVRLFSLRHEFPTEWARFKGIRIEGATKRAALMLNLSAEHYPFWSQGRLGAIKQVDFLAKTKNPVEISTNVDGTGNKDTLGEPSLGNLRRGKLTNIPLQAPIGLFAVYFDDNSMEDIWLALTWGKAD
ncbi:MULTISPECIES: toxin [Cyanophyceae]|uniref:Tc toxin subunit A-related protein n=1 Tax=Cyanophyceae TaxID=3028117 RepID=UPI001682BF94|nr:toxin [Trichocoleus sp. FACHB-69]MBD1930311.1 toxin [Trichocoleus sp. FACHB-69]